MQEIRKNVVILLVFPFHGNQGKLRLDWPLGRNCYQLILLHQPLMSFFRRYLVCVGVNHQKPGVQTAVITDGITEMNSLCTKCFILFIELGNPSFTAMGIFYHLLILSFIRTSVLLYLCHLLLWT